MKDIYKEKATDVANAIDKAKKTGNTYSSAYYEAMGILELGNSWTPYSRELDILITCYFDKGMDGRQFGLPCGRGEFTRDAFIERLAKLLKDNGKKFQEHSESTIYVSEFECEHDGDMEAEKEEITEAGAKVVKTRFNECEETGYIFFSVPLENVKRFEAAKGALWRFHRVVA